MNATFAALLGVAYAQGGGLLKFGGDALLLLYEGDEHAARAARAAFEMRRTLRAIGRPEDLCRSRPAEDARRAPLRPLSVLPGRGSRIASCSSAGPAATQTVEMEATSEAGEILVSAETAGALGDGLARRGEGRRSPASCRTGRPGHGRAAPRRRGHPARDRRPGAAARTAARDRAARGRAPTRLDRLHPLLRHGRDHRDRGARGGRGRARRSRARRAGGRGRAQGDLPRERHRPRRRTDHPRLGRAADLRRRRGADAPHRARRSSTRDCRCRCTSA